MSAVQSATSKSYTSTPLKNKSSVPRSIPRSRSLESTGNSTYSLLSPIYHDSFDLSSEDEEEAQKPCQPANDRSHTTREELSVSFKRNDTVLADVQDASTSKLNLSAWEQWLVSKAKEERVKMQQKVLEEQALKEKRGQEEVEQQKKKAASECKIQEWLQMKRELEKRDKFCRQSLSTKEMLREQQKRLEIEKKAQEKYKEWLQKKKHEENERKLKEEEEKSRRETEEKERKKKAEQTFQEWLKSNKDKERHRRQSSACSGGGYDNLNYPEPSFVNPIPWKPIHIPQETRTSRKNSACRKRTGQPKYQSTPCLSYKSKDMISFAFKR